MNVWFFHLASVLNCKYLFWIYKTGHNWHKYHYKCKKDKCSCASASGRGNIAFGRETFTIKQKSKILSYHVRLRSHSAVDTFSKIDLKSSIFKLQKWFRYQNRLKFNFQSNAPMCPKFGAFSELIYCCWHLVRQVLSTKSWP